MFIIILWIILFFIECFLGVNLSFPANRFGNILLFLPFSLSGTFAIFYVSKIWKNHNNLILFLGKNSLLFLFFQHQAIIFIIKVFKILVSTEKSYTYPIIIAFLVSLLLIIPICVVKKYFPLIAGKSTFLSKGFTNKYF